VGEKNPVRALREYPAQEVYIGLGKG
jgi:hypothetical protein